MRSLLFILLLGAASLLTGCDDYDALYAARVHEKARLDFHTEEVQPDPMSDHAVILRLTNGEIWRAIYFSDYDEMKLSYKALLFPVPALH